MIAKYDKAGNIVAVGDNCHDLARILGITPQAVSHGIHRGSKLYAVIDNEEIEEREQNSKKLESIATTKNEEYKYGRVK